LIFWIADKGPATHFAAVILFSSMDVAISFIPRRSALGTRFSHDHRARSGLPLPILVLAKSSRNLRRALLGSHHQKWRLLLAHGGRKGPIRSRVPPT
jgi:hypothetical protein